MGLIRPGKAISGQRHIKNIQPVRILIFLALLSAVFVANSDAQEPTVTLGLTGSPLAENGGIATVTATLSAASGLDVTVNLAFTGTAIVTTDYTRSNTQIVIPAGGTSGNVTITGVNDGLDENNETVVVDIDSVVNGTESGTQQVTATITDDDAAPTVTLGLTGSPLAENGGIATVTATLSAASGLDVTVNLAFTGTAIVTTDYTRSSAQIVIPAGSPSGNVTITGVNDSINEGNETVIVDIDSVVNGVESGTQQVTAVIADDDGAPTVTLGLAGSPLAENGGVATVTATLSAASGLDVTVNLAYSGTATLTADYTRSSAQIVIPAGSPSGSVTITGVNDSINEGSETVIVDIDSVVNGAESGTQQVTATITDDESAPTVTLGLAGSPLAENGGVATVTATLSAASGLDVTVNLAYSGTATLTADYTRSSAQIVIPAGSPSGNVTITGVNDSINEGSETVIVDIDSVVNGAESGTQQVTAVIADDDGAPTVTLGLAGSPLAENGGIATVAATLSVPSGLAVTVNLAFSGTATLTTDYTRSSAQIVIPAGSPSGSITITGVNDSINEGSETVIVDIDSVVNATESGTQQVTATITDDDGAPTVTLGLTGSPLAENGGIATVTATLSTLSGLAVTVNLAFSGTATLTADYTRSGTQIVIPAGSPNGSITITGVNDVVYEGNETVIVDVSSVVNATESGTQQVTATITDDDSAPTVTLGLTGSPLAENGGIATVTATLSVPSGLAVTVNFAFSGTATLTADYTRSGTQIVIPAGSPSGSITITGVNDSLDEINETVIVDIDSVINATENGIQQVTATITDDDSAPTVSFSGAPYTSAESGSQTVTVALSAASGQTVTVNYATSNGTATAGSDYTAASGTLTWLAGDATSKTFLVPILTDTIDEPNETVNLALSVAVNCTISGTNPTTLTITDDDAAPTVSFSAATYTSAESGSLTVTVALSAASGQTVTVNYATSNGTATAGSDYTAANGVLTWPAGDTAPKTFSVPILPDVIDETNETVLLTLSGPVNATISGTNPATLTITDDDTVTIQTSTDSVNITEGATASFNVQLTAQPLTDLIVTVSRFSGDTDITVQTGASLTFSSALWNVPQPVTLAAAEDADIVNGTATIQLSAPGVTNKDITATEQDNDTLQFATNTDVIGVPENSTAQFQARLTAQPPASVTAAVSWLSGDANITVQSGASLTFTTVNWNDPHQVTLAAAEDVDVANGTATIRISATGLTNKDVTANELDNDTLAFQTSADTVNVTEGSTANFTVQLSAQPSATVTAAVARFSGDANITVQSTASLIFTTGTWNLPQTVTLAAAEDVDIANGTAIIRISATGLTNKDVTANEQDNDTLAFQTSADTVNVPEGATATFDVRLSAQPSSNVSVTVGRASGDSNITVQSGASLTFTMSDWSTFQTVMLAAAEDVDTANGSATIRIQAPGLSDKDVTALEADDDTTNGQITLPIVPAANAAGLFVEVSVAIANNPDPVGSFGVDFSYDDAIFVYKRIEAGTLTPDWTLSSSDISAGKVRLTGLAGTGIPASSSGSLVKVLLQVKCLGYTQDTASQIRIDNYIYDLNDRFLPVPCTSDFTFKPCPTLGDVDADGNITPGDSQVAFEVFLGRAQPDFCQVMTSDSDCDLSITPGDAQFAFEHFLGRRNLPLCCTDYAGFASELLFEEFVRLKRPFPPRRVLYALDTTGLSGEMVTVPMVLAQPQGIRSFSFELSYPADILEYVGVRKSLSTEEFAVVSGQVISTGVVRIEGEGGPPVRRKTIGSLAVAVFRVKEGDAIRFPLRIYNPDKDLANVETRDGTFARLTDSRELKFLSLGEGIMESGVWRVPLEVSNPFQLKAFGLDLGYSFEKMTFLGIERAGLGREIFELDAHEYEPGKIKVGGFNLSQILETTPDVLLELVFSVREQGGQVEINEVMDDFKSFFITKKLSRMD